MQLGYSDGYGWVAGEQPVIVDSLNELDWLNEVVQCALTGKLTGSSSPSKK